jgi:hypothetical protein
MSEATTPAQTPEKEDMDLSLNDLNAMKVIIDIASSRGAFKPNEMAVVGTTYNKLTGFLDNVAKQAEAAKLAKAAAGQPEA